MTQTLETFPQTIETIIDMLKHMDVDGETMQHILKETGMEDQMLRQLVGGANIGTLEYYLTLRGDIV